ncbi:hypothetical protein [Streptosporangium sp. NPDC049376]|uniref:hypothetical protein n=1 Tax=Streptosporangium sp. NPDC049376 TaxID=3366192 RepID=UPI00378DF2A3
MDPLVLAAGTALVTAMATDAWQDARAGVVALWRRFRPEQAEVVEGELVEAHAELLTARQAGDVETERALAGLWQVRLAHLLREAPESAVELRRLLDEELTPLLSVTEQTRIGSIVMKAVVRDQGRLYQAGRDQHINER